MLIFSYVCWLSYPYVFIGEMSIQVFHSFLDWVVFILSCTNSFYILGSNPLSVALFAIIFSHSEGCLSILFTVSFAVQKLLSRICLLLFLFSLLQEVSQRGSCCDVCQRVYLLCFPLRLFAILTFVVAAGTTKAFPFLDNFWGIHFLGLVQVASSHTLVGNASCILLV